MSVAATEEPQRDLTGALLKSVSRSFYLSLRLLPSSLRNPVSLAYLLARTTDTVADTAGAPVAVRLEELKKLRGTILDGRLARANVAENFIGFQHDEAERQLIRLVPQILNAFAMLPEPDREDIRHVLEKILRAQELDLQRFGEGKSVRALETEDQLDEYTYLIAGCVGEFWTEICFRHLSRFARAPKEEMLALGRLYGSGLQLVNILRDTHSDLQAGRCYLPADELQAVGLSPEDLAGAPQAALPVIEKWLTKATDGLNAGMKYVSAIDHRRVRISTALPALIGIQTIRQLREAGAGIVQTRIKIPRSNVRRILVRSVATLGSRATLERLFSSR